MTQVRFTVDDAEVRKVLGQLAPRIGETLRKNAIRAGTRPYVRSLQQLWRSARYEGRGSHRKAIAASIKLDGPKRRGAGPSAPLTFQIGVDYGAKRGGGRQRVWHLLEHGFRHVRAGRRIPGSGRSSVWARQNGQLIARSIQQHILAIARGALK